MGQTKPGSGHAPDRGPAVFAVTVVTLIIASVFVFARMICRRYIVKNVTSGDIIMLIAWVIAFFLSFTVALGTFNGLGSHDRDIHDKNRPRLRRCEYVFSILYVCASHQCCTQLSLEYKN